MKSKSNHSDYQQIFSDSSQMPILANLYIGEAERTLIVDEIARELDKGTGVALIHVEPVPVHNRTSMLLGGAVKNIVAAAYQAAVVSCQRIDMSQHKNGESVIGSFDSISFFPLFARELDAVARVAQGFAAQLSAGLELSTFLFGAAAIQSERRDHRNLRVINYSMLGSKFGTEAYAADYPGSGKFDAKRGVTAVSARLFPIQVVIYLDTQDFEFIDRLIKHAITTESGRSSELLDMHDALLEITNLDEMAELLKKMNIVVDDTTENNAVRVFFHIPDYRETPLDMVIETFQRAMEDLGFTLLAAKLIGYVPSEVLADAGKTAMGIDTAEAVTDDLRYVTRAINALKLNKRDKFNIQKKVLNYYFA